MSDDAGNTSTSAETMRAWSRAAQGTALRRHAQGDLYGAELATTRSRVYTEAADLIEEHGDTDAVPMMLERAGHLRVGVPPLVRFDPAGLRYIAARAWQFCAAHLDPDCPTVQEYWQ